VDDIRRAASNDTSEAGGCFKHSPESTEIESFYLNTEGLKIVKTGGGWLWRECQH
jgi:hypothetical protein